MRYWAAILVIVGSILWLTSGSERPATSVNSGATNSPSDSNKTAVKTPKANSGVISSQEFETFLRETWNALPSERTLAEHPEIDSHHTPPFMLEIAPRLASLEESLIQDPTKLPNAVRFYGDCAYESALMDGLRAYCANRYEKWKGERLTELPPEVATAVKALEGVNP